MSSLRSITHFIHCTLPATRDYALITAHAHPAALLPTVATATMMLLLLLLLSLHLPLFPCVSTLIPRASTKHRRTIPTRTISAGADE